MKFLLLIVTILFLSVLASAEVGIRRPDVPRLGNESGAGGHGIRRNDTVVFYDFAEMGVEQKPHVDKTFFQHPAFANLYLRLKLALSGSVDAETVQIVATKLLELHRASEDLAYNLLNGITRMEWTTVSEEVFRALLPNPAIEISPAQLVTIGFRQGLNVRFNRKYLERLPVIHRAGLVVHEVLSAFVPPRIVDDLQRARTLTGALFSERIKNWSEIAKMAEFFQVTGSAVPLDQLGERQHTGYYLWVSPQEDTSACRSVFSRSTYLPRNVTKDRFSNAACPDPDDVSLFARCRPLAYFYRPSVEIKVGTHRRADGRQVDYLYVDKGPGVYGLLQILGHDSARLQVNGHCRAFADRVYDRFTPDFKTTGLLEAP